MATWATVKRGRIHWLPRWPNSTTAGGCGALLYEMRFESVEIDGCPASDPRLCRRCGKAWGR